jgi:hypothetical protein
LNPDVSEELRVHAVRVLGTSHHRDALDALLRLVDGGKNMFGRPRLAPQTPLVVAALRALSNVWPAQRKAAQYLSLARRSSDTDVRRAAEVAPV